MLPVIAQSLKQEASHKEGWLTGLSNRILLHQKENGIELGVCFPAEGEMSRWGKKNILPGENTLYAFGFPENVHQAEIYCRDTEDRLREIMEEFQPDMVHCFGTEYPHTLAAVRAFGRPEKTLIGIQGLCAVYAEHFRADLPDSVWNRTTFRDKVKKDNLRQQQQKYVLRGKNEIEAIKSVGHVTGRTDWDKHYTKLWNPDVQYHFMNETLRSNFYESEWKLEKCKKHSIFLSQGDYPIKGLHYMLQAMPEIIKKYPDAEIYVAGNSIIKTAAETGLSGLKGKIKLESYGKYILSLMNQTGTLGKVHFLGRLDAEQMKQRYLDSHVFVCPSSIENSPNSVGEAMLLGVPTVCSDVGGVSSIFHGEMCGTGTGSEDEFCKGKEAEKSDGILYTVNDVQALAEAVCRIFAGGEKVENYTKNAREHARESHDPEKNYSRLMEIYDRINQI